MTTKYQTQSCKVKNAKIWQTLILHNCLPLGEQARFTSKNVAQYLLGSRNDYNLFKFNEIKHLLLKFTPLIETLFRSKIVLNYKVGSVRKIRHCKPIPPNDPTRYQEWYARMKNVRIAKQHLAYYYKTVENKRPVKILFASTNPTYAEVIKTSAGICQMNASTNRWLCGYLTANSKSLGQQVKVNKELNTFASHSKIERQFEKTFFENKEAKEKRYNWHNLNMLTQRPALAIIPDVANNDMILRETVAKTIPVIGLVNSDESTKIAYPIFGNSDSIQIVHFFCNFLAVLIAKTFVQLEYKQSSHRIFNRTRAFVNNISKKTKHSSVDTNSKSKILAKSNVFPWIKKRIRFKKVPRTKLKYSKNATRRAIKKSLHNLAKYKYRNNVVNTNNSNFNRLRYVGQKPYWKNLKAMIYLLTKFRYPRKNTRRWRLRKAWKKQEQKKLRRFKLKQNEITNKDIANMISAKSNKFHIAEGHRVETYLIQRYTAKLQKLKKNKVIKSLKNALKKQNKNIFKVLKEGSSNIAKLNKRVIGVIPPRKHKYYKKGYLFKIAKKNKRKALIKAFGHKHLLLKNKRRLLQWCVRFKPRKRKNTWRRIFRKKRKVSMFRSREVRIQKIIHAIVKIKNQHATDSQKSKTFRKIYMNLKQKKVQIKNMKLLYEKRKASKFSKSIWRSPRLFKAMVNKYPYYTILAKSLVTEKNPALSKNAFKILSYELSNKKTNPYSLSLTNLHRKNKISNSILWQKLYYKNWVIKWKKKRFTQIAKRSVFYVTSKIKKRGLIGPFRKTNMYYFRKLLHLSNSKNFPTYVKKIKTSFNKRLVKNSKRRTKSVRYYHRKLRRLIFKFRRFHQILPSLARRYMPWRKNYRNRYKRRKSKKSFNLNNNSRKNNKSYPKKKSAFWSKKNSNKFENNRNKKNNFKSMPNKNAKAFSLGFAKDKNQKNFNGFKHSQKTLNKKGFANQNKNPKLNLSVQKKQQKVVSKKEVMSTNNKKIITKENVSKASNGGFKVKKYKQNTKNDKKR